MSLPISIALMPTPLTANQLSVMLVAIGFYSAWLFSIGHYWSRASLGAFLSLAASVLDGCDGEIARLEVPGVRARLLDRNLRRLLVLHRDLHRPDDRRGAADRMGRLLLDRRASRWAGRC